MYGSKERGDRIVGPQRLHAQQLDRDVRLSLANDGYFVERKTDAGLAWKPHPSVHVVETGHIILGFTCCACARYIAVGWAGWDQRSDDHWVRARDIRNGRSIREEIVNGCEVTCDGCTVRLAAKKSVLPSSS